MPVHAVSVFVSVFAVVGVVGVVVVVVVVVDEVVTLTRRACALLNQLAKCRTVCRVPHSTST